MRELCYGETVIAPSTVGEEQRMLQLALLASRSDMGPGLAGLGSGGASGSGHVASDESGDVVSLLQQTAAVGSTRSAAPGPPDLRLRLWWRLPLRKTGCASSAIAAQAVSYS